MTRAGRGTAASSRHVRAGRERPQRAGCARPTRRHGSAHWLVAPPEKVNRRRTRCRCDTFAAMHFRAALSTFGSGSRSLADERQARKHLNTSHPTARSCKARRFFVFQPSSLCLLLSKEFHDHSSTPFQRCLVPKRRENQRNRRRTYQGNHRVATARASDPLLPDSRNQGREA